MKHNYLFKSFGIAMLAACFTSTSAQVSPYITRVLEYKPAPGQFTNNLPEYEIGDTAEEMCRKVESYISNNAKGMISLGGYGGYVVVGFDHTIQNVPDAYDFKIYGNAFYSNSNPGVDNPRFGGSCEPGIVMVAYDANRNGVPDEHEWYEIAGSEYHRPETLKNYEITYYRPDPNKQPVPDPNNSSLNDITYIRWTDNQGEEGFIARNIFHAQNYFPEWIEEDQVTFRGTRLANNGVDESGTGNYFVLYAYDFGYADNHPNDNELASIKIEWAVDSEGFPVNLPGVDFIKIYTGVNQCNGWLGECSTEVMGVEDLNPGAATTIYETSAVQLFVYTDPQTQNLIIQADQPVHLSVYAVTGHCMIQDRVSGGKSQISMLDWKPGVYMVKINGYYKKIIKY